MVSGWHFAAKQNGVWLVDSGGDGVSQVDNGRQNGVGTRQRGVMVVADGIHQGVRKAPAFGNQAAHTGMVDAD